MSGSTRKFDRDAALDIALHAFWTRGFEQTSIAQLTEAIGINPPSLYAAFGNKEQLFTEAADRYITRFHRGVLASLELPETGAAIAALLDAAARAHTRPGRPAGCLILSEPRLGAEREYLRSRIAERIRRGQDDGDLAADTDPEDVAALIEAVLAGMSARARDGGSLAELRAIARLALRSLPHS